jgi:hypothetical protein
MGLSSIFSGGTPAASQAARAEAAMPLARAQPGTRRQMALWGSVTGVAPEEIERGSRVLHDEFMENWDDGRPAIADRARAAQDADRKDS